jgi:hypothetical protein
LNPTNNRWSNLRLATKAQNNANSHVRKDSTTGVKGVERTPGGKYRARIKANGRMHSLLTSSSPELCYAAHALADWLIHGDFAPSSSITFIDSEI